MVRYQIEQLETQPYVQISKVANFSISLFLWLHYMYVYIIHTIYYVVYIIPTIETQNVSE